MEIPDFLIEMSKQMHEQNNRITADPIWMVCYDKKHITANGYEDFIEFIDIKGQYEIIYSTEDDSLAEAYNFIEWVEDNEIDMEEEQLSRIRELSLIGSAHKEIMDYLTWDGPDRVQKSYMKREREVVKACLTESDANWFIKRKQHDYPKLYTYVFSMYHCPQMIELRNWILSLTKKGSSNES